MSLIPYIILAVSHKYQQLHIRGLQTVRKFKKLLHVSASRRHPHGLSEIQMDHKHYYTSLEVQYLGLCSTTPNVSI